MPLPKGLARFNRWVTNPMTRTFAGRLPGFAIVVHRGRTSGRLYRTPVNAFARPDGGYTLALTYGPDSQWVRNVVAQGGCTLETAGRRVEQTNPRVVHDPSRRPVPPPVRAVLALLRVEYFMELDRAPGGAPR
jgi:deazaflavin-dependent oxidoreductase (nitroreductase family)